MLFYGYYIIRYTNSLCDCNHLYIHVDRDTIPIRITASLEGYYNIVSRYLMVGKFGDSSAIRPKLKPSKVVVTIKSIHLPNQTLEFANILTYGSCLLL